MANINTTTLKIDGAATEGEQVVAVKDQRRRYIAFYAKTGTCKLSFGEGTHTENYISLAQGNLLEMAVNLCDKVTFSTTGAILNVIQDITSNVCLTSDDLCLTSDSTPLTYNISNRKPRNPAPVFG